MNVQWDGKPPKTLEPKDFTWALGGAEGRQDGVPGVRRKGLPQPAPPVIHPAGR